MLFIISIERLPRPQLRAPQKARLKEQVVYMYDRVPCHRQNSNALGVHTSTFCGLRDLGKLGFTRKDKTTIGLRRKSVSPSFDTLPRSESSKRNRVHTC